MRAQRAVTADAVVVTDAERDRGSLQWPVSETMLSGWPLAWIGTASETPT
jgi:hypothetical protein